MIYILPEDFVKNFLQLFWDSLRTSWGLSEDFLKTVKGLFKVFSSFFSLKTVLGLPKDCLRALQIVIDFLNLFRHNIVRQTIVWCSFNRPFALLSYEIIINFFSRPGQSHGLHYKHLCHSFINYLSELTFSSHSFTAPSRPNG